MRRWWHTLPTNGPGRGLGVGLCVGLLGALTLGGMPAAQASTDPFFQTPYDTIPNFAQTPTIRSRASGDWASATTWDAGRAPASTDVVAIVTGHTVTVRTQTATAKTVGIWAGALLAFDPQQNTRLTVGTLLVMPGGALEVGTAATSIDAGKTAEIAIADQPLDVASDPNRYGTGLLVIDGRVTMHGAAKTPTFVRLAGEARATDTSLNPAQAISGWQPQDRLVLPDSRHLKEGEWWGNYVPQWEDLMLAGVVGNLALTSPLRFNHPGARNGAGLLDFLPHVGNATRNVKIRSANPAGTRGHTFLTNTAAVDIQYVEFRHLGRTTNADLNPATNHIGRYALHLHHVRGPANPSNQGHQFTVVGNAVTDSTKWPLTVHDSHYGLIQDNVVFNGQGAGIVTEDGNESYNEFAGNFVVAIQGDVNPRDTDGRDGSAFWFHGFNHHVQNNVAANAINHNQFNVSGSGYNFFWPPASTRSTRVPLYRGADLVGGQEGVDYQLVNMQLLPVPEFTGNEAYGATSTGLVIWTLGTDGYGTSDVGETVIRDFAAWHVWQTGFYAYPIQNVTFDGFVVRGDPASRASWTGSGWESGDYWAGNVTIRRADIQGMAAGIGEVDNSPGTFTIENSYFRNLNANISRQTPRTPGTGAGILPRTTVIRSVRFDAWPGYSPSSIAMEYPNPPLPASNVIQQDWVFVYDYNQQPGVNFRVFYLEQDPNFVVPQSDPSQRLVGAPEPGLTNAQTWARYGLAIAGAVAPCATTRPEIHGFVCPTGPPPTATLTVAKTGTGSGTVTSADGGIACGPTCTHTYPVNTSVTLTAAPAVDSTFAGWSGAGCGATVVMSGDRTCTATFTSTGGPPLTLTSLTPDRVSPQPVGTTITFTAVGTGGTPPYQAKWWVSVDGGAHYAVARDWGPGLTFPWTPTQANPNYRVGVWLRSAGNGADTWEAGGAVPFAVAGGAPLTMTGLTADRASPQPLGTSLTVTATATGGTAPYQAKWWVSVDGGAHYAVARDWGPGLTFTWTPTAANANYRVGVWLRSAGNPADTYEAGGAIPFAITGSPLTLTSLTANRASPQPVGTSIIFTAVGSGGTPPYQAKWWVSTDGGAHYTVVRDWAAGTTFTWTPTQPNANYRVGVWLRSAGATADLYEAGGAILFAITGSPLTLTNVTADMPAPQPVGTAITLTAAATGGTTPYQSKWWVSADGGAHYSVVRDWATGATFTWTPTQANPNYRVGVWLRSAGATADLYEAGGAVPFAITGGPGGVTLGGDLPGPLPLFPATNWWNLDISAAPVDANSAAFLQFIGPSRGLHPDFGGDVSPGSVETYGMPYIVVDGSQPKKAVNFFYADESDGVDHGTGQSFPFYPIPDEAITQAHWVEGGEPGNLDLRAEGDRHMLIVDRDNKYLYELFNVFYDGTTWQAGSGAFFDMKTDNRRPDGWTSADAAGLAILPGLVRYDEVFGPDEIRHAFRVTVRATNGYVYPASHRAGSNPQALPMGARLRLRASRDLSGFPPEVQKIFRAMQKYGLIVADNGSDMFITGTYHPHWNNDVLNPAFRALTAGDFEVIELGYQGP